MKIEHLNGSFYLISTFLKTFKNSNLAKIMLANLIFFFAASSSFFDMETMQTSINYYAIPRLRFFSLQRERLLYYYVLSNTYYFVNNIIIIMKKQSI